MKTLREQMSDAMILRGFATRTQESGLAAVKALAKYYRRSPDLLSTEEVEAYVKRWVSTLNFRCVSLPPIRECLQRLGTSRPPYRFAVLGFSSPVRSFDQP